MDEVEKKQSRLGLSAAAAVVFLFLLAGISILGPFPGYLSENLQIGVSPSDPALIEPASESSRFDQLSTFIGFTLPIFHPQSKSADGFFSAGNLRSDITPAVSPRGPPALS